jgi:hypothetical protein
VNDPIASGFWFAEIEHGGMLARGAARPAQSKVLNEILCQKTLPANCASPRTDLA